VNAVLDNLDILVDGFLGTVRLTLLSAVGALVLGVLIAGMRVSPVPPLRWAGTFYVQTVRNTPLTLVLFFCAFGLPQIGVTFGFYVAALIGLTTYTAAFVAEAVRSGINSVSAGQAEASRSIGMTFVQTLGIVVLPQALRAVIPPLSSIFIALLKNSSIAGAFGVAEAFQSMNRLINSFGSAVLYVLGATAVGYLILALLVSAGFSWLERKVAIAR
jgi:glutamate transport system permease protein